MRTLITLSFCFLALTATFAQQARTGHVDYPTLGLSFTIPSGWMGQEQNNMFIMGNQSLPGFILMVENEATSVAQIKQEAAAGIAEANGTNLQMQGGFDAIGSNGVGAIFEGTMEGQASKAYVAGVVNPYGSGITIIAITLKDKYTDQYKTAATSLAKSLQFKKPDYGPIVDQWKEKLNGVKLTHMNSYSSNSGGGFGGYSDKYVIDLCPQGFFNYNGSSHTHIDVGSTATIDGRGAGAGQWKIIGNTEGKAVLQLNFKNGEVYEYTLSTDEKDYTTLNGKRYYRTWTGENAPTCN